MSFVIKDEAGKSYFKNPSFERWDLVKDKSHATVFSSPAEASKMVETLNRAIYSTYWDWSDTIPKPVVEES